MVKIPFNKSEPFTTTSSARTKFLENFSASATYYNISLQDSTEVQLLMQDLETLEF